MRNLTLLIVALLVGCGKPIQQTPAEQASAEHASNWMPHCVCSHDFLQGNVPEQDRIPYCDEIQKMDECP